MPSRCGTAEGKTFVKIHMTETDRCRDCGKLPEADGDHNCTCPYPDDFCPDHPRSEDPWNPDSEVLE